MPDPAVEKDEVILNSGAGLTIGSVPPMSAGRLQAQDSPLDQPPDERR